MKLLAARNVGWFLVLGTVIASGCGQKKQAAPGGPAPTVADDAAAPIDDAGAAGKAGHDRADLVATWDALPVTRDPDGRHWLAIAHGESSKMARVHAIDLGDGGQGGTSNNLGDHPAMVHANWPDHYRVLAARDGRRWVWAQSAGSDDDLSYSLVIRTGDAIKGKIDLGPVEPTGLHLIGDALFVGSRGAAVQWFDLSDPAAPATEVVRRKHHASKGYDLFAQSGNYLLAIDDVVMPMYADWFEMTPGGLRRLGDWSMPGVINGHYNGAALLPRKGDHFWLFVTASYGIMSGSGQNLAALDIRGTELQFTEGLILQNAGPDDRVVEEHQPRPGSPGTPTRLAGTELTSWTGMAVHPATEQVLLAAGSRGLMIVPADFDASSKATLVDVGGPVHDVAVRSGRVVALVGNQGMKQSELTDLVVVEMSAGQASVSRRMSLPGPFTQLVP